MMDAEETERRLKRLLVRTQGADNVKGPAWWGEGNADERRALDDLHTGRLAWREARRTAKRGLEELTVGKVELAADLWFIANDFYIDALESRIEPKDVVFLSSSAKRRGRRKAADRKER
ncbi:hypothetical protein RDV64_03305 [Acuticoccus sp. MNP-M23]|uniref:hypothetical protein n=1 Tax=Acuticoccus sp. MNP-M23 TaxID=3072793 RepID=UPI002814BD51|nr:hypothetical protein [Acuticoccus sp. MNP-M23]WMS43445.1 hypothetical protein RDV64_03305 [Acuticoccus sp. MNP-M23]